VGQVQFNPDEYPSRLRFRRAAFSTIAVVLVVVVCEILSFLGLSLKAGRVMTLGAIREQRVVAVNQGSGILGGEESTANEWYPQHAVHPYLGFVLDRKFRTSPRRRLGGEEALSFGFELAEPGLFHEPRIDGLVVGVTGGSLAFNFAQHMAPTLRSRLGEALGLSAEKVVVVDIALPGYKQPQQLMTLSYLLSLGIHLDVVVNIDGFNEVALPPTENVRHGVAASYPRGWRLRVGDLDQQTRLNVAELGLVSRRRLDLAETFDRRPLRWSFVAGVAWSVLDSRHARRAASLELALERSGDGEDQSYTVTGPAREYASEGAVLEDLVALWSRASHLMDGITRPAGITYLHFLQPNQYLPGSKPMEVEEVARAINPRSRYGKWVKRGYPLLIEGGRKLRDDGVRFFDGSMLFADTEGPVYVDTCCHLNELGETILAEAVIDAIVAETPASR
jgi:hypothetical protein